MQDSERGLGTSAVGLSHSRVAAFDTAGGRLLSGAHQNGGRPITFLAEMDFRHRVDTGAVTEVETEGETSERIPRTSRGYSHPTVQSMFLEAVALRPNKDLPRSSG